MHMCACMQVGLAVDDIKGILQAATLTRLAMRVSNMHATTCLNDINIWHTLIIIYASCSVIVVQDHRHNLRVGGGGIGKY